MDFSAPYNREQWLTRLRVAKEIGFLVIASPEIGGDLRDVGLPHSTTYPQYREHKTEYLAQTRKKETWKADETHVCYWFSDEVKAKIKETIPDFNPYMLENEAMMDSAFYAFKNILDRRRELYKKQNEQGPWVPS